MAEDALPSTTEQAGEHKMVMQARAKAAAAITRLGLPNTGGALKVRVTIGKIPSTVSEDDTYREDGSLNTDGTWEHRARAEEMRATEGCWEVANKTLFMTF